MAEKSLILWDQVKNNSGYKCTKESYGKKQNFRIIRTLSAHIV